MATEITLIKSERCQRRDIRAGAVSELGSTSAGRGNRESSQLKIMYFVWNASVAEK